MENTNTITKRCMGIDKSARMPIFFYLSALIFCDNTYIYYGAVLFLLGYKALHIDRNRIIKNDFLVVSNLILAIYLSACAIFGGALYPSITYNRCIVMVFNVIVNACIASELINQEMREWVLRIYCKIVFFFEIYIISLSGSNLLKGRLGELLYSPIAFGGTYNANGVGIILVIAVTIMLNMYMYNGYKKYLVVILMYEFGILLTGSRKAIIISAAIFVFLPIIYNYYNDKNGLYKNIKHMMSVAVVLTVLLVLLFKVPFLYDIAGYRIEALLTSNVEDGVYTEKSLQYRHILVDIAKEYFKESPIHGIGMDNFQMVNIYNKYTHNNYWEMLVGGGIIGFTIYYLPYVNIIVSLIKKRKSSIKHIYVFIILMLALMIMETQIVTYSHHLCILLIYIANAVRKTKEGDGDENQTFNQSV